MPRVHSAEANGSFTGVSADAADDVQSPFLRSWRNLLEETGCHQGRAADSGSRERPHRRRRVRLLGRADLADLAWRRANVFGGHTHADGNCGADRFIDLNSEPSAHSHRAADAHLQANPQTHCPSTVDAHAIAATGCPTADPQLVLHQRDQLQESVLTRRRDHGVEHRWRNPDLAGFPDGLLGKPQFRRRVVSRRPLAADDDELVRPRYSTGWDCLHHVYQQWRGCASDGRMRPKLMEDHGGWMIVGCAATLRENSRTDARVMQP